MDVSAFDLDLPPELIAQEAAPDRAASRLMCLDRATGAIAHAHVSELPERLTPGDLVVVNNTKVFPARLLGHRVPSGGAVECLLLGPASSMPLDSDSAPRIPHPGPQI